LHNKDDFINPLYDAQAEEHAYKKQDKGILTPNARYVRYWVSMYTHKTPVVDKVSSDEPKEMTVGLIVDGKSVIRTVPMQELELAVESGDPLGVTRLS
jgi:hypothetical protein